MQLRRKLPFVLRAASQCLHCGIVNLALLVLIRYLHGIKGLYVCTASSAVTGMEGM